MKRKNHLRKVLMEADVVPTSKWQNPLVLVGIAALGAATTISVVVLLTPLDGPTISSDSEPRLGLDQTDSASSEQSRVEMSNEDWWKLPSEPEVIQLELLKVEMLSQAKRLERQYPKNAKALDLCASVYYDVNQLDEADRLWKTCLALNPTKVDYYLSYSEFLASNEKTDEAIRVLEDAHSRKIETAGSYLQLAKVYEGAGNLLKAAELSKEVTQRFPEFADSWFLTGRVLNQQGEHAESESCLRRALSLNHPEHEVLPVLVSVLARQGRRDEAKQLQEKLKSLEKPALAENEEPQPFQVRFESSLRDRAARLYFFSAMVEKEANNTSEMFPLVQRSLKLKPNDSSALVFLAEQYVEQNRIGEAIEVYKRLIDIQPENLVHFTNLAGLAFRQRDLGLAESVLAKGVQAHPKNDVLQIALAKTYISQRRPLEARALMNKVLAKVQHPEAYMVLGASYQLTGNMDESRAAFERAQQIAPNQKLPR